MTDSGQMPRIRSDLKMRTQEMHAAIGRLVLSWSSLQRSLDSIIVACESIFPYSGAAPIRPRTYVKYKRDGVEEEHLDKRIKYRLAYLRKMLRDARVNDESVKTIAGLYHSLRPIEPMRNGFAHLDVLLNPYDDGDGEVQILPGRSSTSTIHTSIAEINKACEVVDEAERQVWGARRKMSRVILSQPHGDAWRWLTRLRVDPSALDQGGR